MAMDEEVTRWMGLKYKLTNNRRDDYFITE
jgi:hypothetical protein